MLLSGDYTPLSLDVTVSTVRRSRFRRLDVTKTVAWDAARTSRRYTYDIRKAESVSLGPLWEISLFRLMQWLRLPRNDPRRIRLAESPRWPSSCRGWSRPR